ncbi:MAG: hypothetical protein AAF515_04980 [Pseudomonadota bacterium]
MGAHADDRSQAKRIHDRLTGVPPDVATLDALEITLAADPLQAALDALEHPRFYNVTLKNFAAPWTNRDGSVFVPLNDYTATVIGIVRDDVDFREVLSGDIAYIGSSGPAYSTTGNAHFAALEDADVDLGADLTRVTQSSLNGLPSTATAGVMTSRAAAQAFFIAGTNRAMLRFTLMNHLCHDLEQVHDTTRSPDRIRQDVSRSPGGDSRVFLNNCIGCHSGMDPLAQAYAYYDFSFDAEADPEGETGQIMYNDAGTTDPISGTQVVAKYFNNEATFPQGFATPNDSWANYWRDGVNSRLGWDSSRAASGNGAKSMGAELANSEAFASCQVTKVFENVCLRAPADSTDRNQIAAMTASFQSNGYRLKRVFAEAAVYCMGD